MSYDWNCLENVITHTAKRKDNGEEIKGYIWAGADHIFITPKNLGVDYNEKENRITACAYEVIPETVKPVAHLSYEQLHALKLLTSAAICYSRIKGKIEERISASSDIADLYFDCPTVQTTTLDFSLQELADSKISCDNLTSFAKILEAMPTFKHYLEKLRNK